MAFRDRTDAGRQLADVLRHRRTDDVVVLGLPRGGVPVAHEVAQALGAPLDVILVRKLGVPFQPELAMGAIGEDGVRFLNDEVLRMARVSATELAKVESAQRTELDRRAVRYRRGRSRLDIASRTVIVVDDGVATGSTARVGCRVARAHGAARVVLAVPVAPPDVYQRFAEDADEVVVLETPEPFGAVGQFYDRFDQVSDDTVVGLLDASGRVDDDPPPVSAEVEIPADEVVLEGHLELPEHPSGLVIFAHGSGSSRHSPRNRFVASVLNEAGIGTLLFDLLTADEELDRANVFDIDLLARRLLAVASWARSEAATAALPLGFFGASTGAAAALWAASESDASIAAVVSRGGRPDLAERRLAQVSAPTLLIVGGHDDVVLDLNREAAARLRGEHELVVVPGATHLFEEPGTLRQAADAASQWFRRHFG